MLEKSLTINIARLKKQEEQRNFCVSKLRTTKAILKKANVIDSVIDIVIDNILEDS